MKETSTGLQTLTQSSFLTAVAHLETDPTLEESLETNRNMIMYVNRKVIRLYLIIKTQQTVQVHSTQAF